MSSMSLADRIRAKRMSSEDQEAIVNDDKDQFLTEGHDLAMDQASEANEGKSDFLSAEDDPVEQRKSVIRKMMSELAK